MGPEYDVSTSRVSNAANDLKMYLGPQSWVFQMIPEALKDFYVIVSVVTK